MTGNVEVIVRYREVPSDKHHLKVTKGGGALKNKFDLIRSGHYSVPAAVLQDLANDPDVQFVSPNRPLQGMLDLTTAVVNAAAAANYALDGKGVGIAVIDSGVNRAYDLQNPIGSRVVYSEDFTGLGVTNDIYGHGTHVAGIAAGNGRTSSNQSGATRALAGVAIRASIINLRVLDDSGRGTDSSVIAAIQRAISIKATYNIRVMNLSIGRAVSGSYKTDPLCQAVEAAWKAGIVVVVSAGNQGRNNNGGINGYGTVTVPGNDPYVITVGAMKTVNTPGRTDDKIASYSSKGPTLYDHIVKPDIVAPGNLVSSILNSTSGTLFTHYPTTQVPMSYYVPGSTGVSPGYLTLSGTSMATPVVSGAAALLIQQNPALTPDQVKARLMKTAYKSFPALSTVTDPSSGAIYTSYYDLFTVGAGYLDLQAALANTDIASLPAHSPAAVFNAATRQVSLVSGTNVVWGSNLVWASIVVWGSNVVWGSSVLQANNLVWGSNVVWGDSTTQGFNVVWGDGLNGSINPASVVWGSNFALDAMAVLTQGEN